MIRISKNQLFCLIMIFEIGSTTLFALGIKAKQDAWLAVLVAMLFGFTLIWVYTELQKFFPDKNLAEISITLLGKFFGSLLALFYAFYFIHIATLNINEFSNIIVLTFLPNTPLVVVESIFMLTAFYFLFLGFEVVGRTSEIALPAVLFFLLSTYILVILSGQANFKELTPVLGNGVINVINAAFPQIINFPFGEMVLFLMYWNYADSKQLIRKISTLAVAASGLLLSFSLVIIVSTLGVNYADVSTIPFLEVLKLINVGDVLTNLDSLGIVIICIGGIYKMTLFFYGAVLALSAVFKIKETRILVIPVGIIIVWMSIVTLPSFVFQRWFGQNITTPYIHIPFQIIFPLLLLLICVVKKKLRKLN